MASEPRRDPVADSLITPQNAAFVLIDYQPVQVDSIASMERQRLVSNIVRATRAAIGFGLPVIHSTVNVQSGRNKPTIAPLRELLEGRPVFDRTSINAWEDEGFRQAVEATGRRKLVMAALWTETCLTFPALDALRAGYEVYALADAVGGTSVVAHEMGLRRIEQAGACMTSVPQLFCELQRDWQRTETLPAFLPLFVDMGGSAGVVAAAP